MMVFRRGSESNIKSDLGIWRQYLFNLAFKHFYGINTTRLYSTFIKYIRLNFIHFNLQFQFNALKALFFHFLF